MTTGRDYTLLCRRVGEVPERTSTDASKPAHLFNGWLASFASCDGVVTFDSAVLPRACCLSCRRALQHWHLSRSRLEARFSSRTILEIMFAASIVLNIAPTAPPLSPSSLPLQAGECGDEGTVPRGHGHGRDILGGYVTPPLVLEESDRAGEVTCVNQRPT